MNIVYHNCKTCLFCGTDVLYTGLKIYNDLWMCSGDKPHCMCGLKHLLALCTSPIHVQTIIIPRVAQPGLKQRALPIIQQWGGGLHWETALLASDLLSTSKAVSGSGELTQPPASQ